MRVSKLAPGAVAVALAVAACGGSDNPTGKPSQSREAAMKQAMLKYAKCMRDHGVNMPDPQFDSNGGGTVRIEQRGGKEADPAKARAAENACRHFQDEVKPPPMSEKQQAEMRKRALANSKCMRDHGIANFPDPQFGTDGRMTMEIKKGSGFDPNSPKFQAAQKACMKVSGKGGMIMQSDRP